jgi:hypothetical protein
MRGARALIGPAAVAALVMGLTTGCGPGGGAAEKAPATPSGYPEMQKKVAAAESALAKADRDASQDTDN